jgi:hypothetical protein
MQRTARQLYKTVTCSVNQCPSWQTHASFSGAHKTAVRNNFVNTEGVVSETHVDLLIGNNDRRHSIQKLGGM